MKKVFVIKILSIFFLTGFTQPQEKQNFKVVFYNTENFFDCFDDFLQMMQNFCQMEREVGLLQNIRKNKIILVK